MRAKKLLHSCHPHPITEITVLKPGVLDCSCCELGLSGPTFVCYERQCIIEPKPLFCIHKSCAELPQNISHKTHPAHDLTLLRTQQAGGFTCNACGEAGDSGSSYNCSTCDYHLHVKCSSLPGVVIRDDHEHSLRLVYSFQNNADDVDLLCDICGDRVKHGYWAYCCARCDVFAHLKCAKQDLKVGENEQVVASQPDLEATLQEMQLEMMRSNQHRNQMHNIRMSQIRMGFIG